MKDSLGVSPSKGNQGTARGKEKILYLGGNRTHDLRIRSAVTLPTELRGRAEKVGDDLGGESQRRESTLTSESTSSFVSFSEQKISDNQNLFSMVSCCFCLFSPLAKNFERKSDLYK